MLENLEPIRAVKLCRMAIVLNELQETDRVILEAALADEKKWPAKTLEKALKTRGVVAADNTITRHRQGICPCSKN